MKSEKGRSIVWGWLLYFSVVGGFVGVVLLLGVVGGCYDVGVNLTFIGLLMAAFAFMYGVWYRAVERALDTGEEYESVSGRIIFRDEEEYPGAEGIVRVVGEIVVERFVLQRRMLFALIPYLLSVFCVVVGFMGVGDWLIMVGVGALLFAFILAGYWSVELFYISDKEIERKREKAEELMRKEI